MPGTSIFLFCFSRTWNLFLYIQNPSFHQSIYSTCPNELLLWWWLIHSINDGPPYFGSRRLFKGKNREKMKEREREVTLVSVEFFTCLKRHTELAAKQSSSYRVVPKGNYRYSRSSHWNAFVPTKLIWWCPILVRNEISCWFVNRHMKFILLLTSQAAT